MDNTDDIKKRIHEFIDHADERILKILNAIITAEETQEELDTTHKAILDERLEEHRNNPTSGKPWKEAKKELEN